MVTTATGFGLGNGGVLGVAGIVARLGAEAEVTARMEATGHRGALACSASRPCRPWRHWLTWALRGLVRAEPLLAQGEYWQVGVSVVILFDKVRSSREGRRRE